MPANSSGHPKRQGSGLLSHGVRPRCRGRSADSLQQDRSWHVSGVRVYPRESYIGKAHFEYGNEEEDRHRVNELRPEEQDVYGEESEESACSTSQQADWLPRHLKRPYERDTMDQFFYSLETELGGLQKQLRSTEATNVTRVGGYLLHLTKECFFIYLY
ncbi:unnamed protein product [Protopolystoma xenopodis]|uniref:Uncharacterized protein n=1 Tax=Protopolystoma xenopodis TaxID=117903 RepID=A0A448WRV3_9PLAT|nr:unnamed protein product [Protopolystoma xenopodis]